MHETRDEQGALCAVEFYEVERCYRVFRVETPSGAEWRVTVDGHPHGIGFQATDADRADDVRARTLARVNEHGG